MDEENEKDLSVDNEAENQTKDTANVEDTKSYSQQEVDEMKAKWEGNFQKKLDKAISRKMRAYDDEEFKKDQLIDVLKKQTNQSSLDGLLDMSEKQYGVTISRTRSNKNDDKVLGKYDAKEILDAQDDEYVNQEFNRLANVNRTVREEETYSELNNYLQNKKVTEKRLKEIKENGLDEDIVDSEEFKSFSEKFNKDTSIKDIYDMYEKINGTKKQKPFSAGSLKDIDSKKAPDEFFTIEEFNALTDEDLKNDKIYEKAMKSMNHFYKK